MTAGLDNYLVEHWYALMNAMSLPSNNNVRDRLLDAYQQPHRHYHTVKHLADCLENYEQVKHQAIDADNIALALWFHDAIYQPMRNDNELASAQWAMQFMREANLSTQRMQAIHALIMATQHNVVPTDHDQQLLVDIDLSILGSSPDRYDQFEHDVRNEYRWVPGFIFRKKRKEILQSFLDRDRIYLNDYFFLRFEQSARENLSRTVALLQEK